MFRSDTLFARFMNTLFDVLFIGILWIVGCIPLFTIVTSSTAGYYAMSKVVKHKTGYPFREYVNAFKTNFKQTWITGILFLLIVGVLVADGWYLWGNRSQMNDALFIAVVGIAFLVLCIAAFYCALLSRFNKNNVEMIKFSAMIGFRFLYLSVAIIVGFAVMVVGIYLMPWAILVLPGVYLWGISFPCEWVLKKLMPVPEEGSEEAEKWYYV